MDQGVDNKQSIINLVVVLILTSIAVYLGYQNYQLRSQLLLVQDKQSASDINPRPTLCDSNNKPTNTPTPTSVPLDLSDLPIATLNSPADTSDWQTYQNQTYRYQVQYPPDWRIAELLTEDRNQYRDSKNEYVVVLTNLSLEEEQSVKQEIDLENATPGMGVGYNYVDSADGRIIIISPTTFDPKDAQGDVGFKYTPVQKWKLSNDLTATEWHQLITWEMYIDADIIDIPYSGDQAIRSEPVVNIYLQIERNDGDYEREVFEQIASTFKYY